MRGARHRVAGARSITVFSNQLRTMVRKGNVMSIKSFCFLQRDAAKLESQRVFMAVVLSTGRFWRNEKSSIMFEVAPNDFCLIERKQGFRTILEDGEVLQLTGDVDDTTYDILWIWLTAAKWKLPRLNPEKPYSPSRPLPVRNVGVVRR